MSDSCHLLGQRRQPGWETEVRILWAALALAPFAATACNRSTAPEATPDLLRQALTAPSSATAPAFLYDFEEATSGGSGDERTASLVRGQVDLSREKGDRVTITFVENASGEPADIERIDQRYERRAEGLTFCDTLSAAEVTNVVDKGSGPDGRLFTFTPNPEGAGNDQFRDVMTKMMAEAVVDEASSTLRSFSASLSRPHNIMLVAEIKAASIEADCAPGPDGRAYATRMAFDFSGSAFGQAFGIKSTQAISNVRIAE
jgi:hypothetical protein